MASVDLRQVNPVRTGLCAGAGVLDQFLDVHGEQDGPVDHQVALGGRDLAAAGLLT